MATKRTPLSRPSRLIITPEMVRLFARALDIEDIEGAVERWEEDGGRRREYLDLGNRLHALLGRKPWQENVLWVADDGEPPPWMSDNSALDYLEAQGVRSLLWAALEDMEDDAAVRTI